MHCKKNALTKFNIDFPFHFHPYSFIHSFIHFDPLVLASSMQISNIWVKSNWRDKKSAESIFCWNPRCSFRRRSRIVSFASMPRSIKSFFSPWYLLANSRLNFRSFEAVNLQQAQRWFTKLSMSSKMRICVASGNAKMRSVSASLTLFSFRSMLANFDWISSTLKFFIHNLTFILRAYFGSFSWPQFWQTVTAKNSFLGQRHANLTLKIYIQKKLQKM